MERRYMVVDVFTDTPFGGNPLAVVLDAEGLSSLRMQQIAAEFGFSETSFALPATDRRNTALVRIFTPRQELKFAGHPNIGTAYVLGNLTRDPPALLDFEQGAGVVRLALQHGRGKGGGVTGAELTAPLPLTRGVTADPSAVAPCLGLPDAAIRLDAHAPVVAGVGLDFLFVELATRADLAAARPDLAAHQALLPALGVDGIYAYWRDGTTRTLHARMFAPIDGIVEDPATGSATAAVVALLADLAGADALELDVRQGDDMGRPSRLRAQAARTANGMKAQVGGTCVAVMQGVLMDGVA